MLFVSPVFSTNGFSGGVGPNGNRRFSQPQNRPQSCPEGLRVPLLALQAKELRRQRPDPSHWSCIRCSSHGRESPRPLLVLGLSSPAISKQGDKAGPICKICGKSQEFQKLSLAAIRDYRIGEFKGGVGDKSHILPRNSRHHYPSDILLHLTSL